MKADKKKTLSSPELEKQAEKRIYFSNPQRKYQA